MTTTKRSFEKDLWDGIKVVYERYDEGRRTLSDLIKLFSDLSEAETDFAKDVSKIASRSSSVTEKGTVNEAWNGLKRGHEAISKAMSDKAQQVKRDVVGPLEQLKKNQGVQKETLEKKVQTQFKALEKAKENLTKAKARYHANSRAAEQALHAYEKAQQDPTSQSAKLTKLNANQQQLKKEAEASDAQYRLVIKEFNSVLASYEKEMKAILAEFQEMETKRIEGVFEVLKKYSALMAGFGSSHDMSKVAVAKTVDGINPAADVQLFIEEKKTGEVPAAPAEYEAYVPQGADGTGSGSESGSFTPSRAGGSRPGSLRVNDDHAGNRASKELKPEQVRSALSKGSDSASHSTSSSPATSKIVLNAKIVCKAKALYDFAGSQEGELRFSVGDVIDVTQMDDSGWWQGILNGKSGIFPANHVRSVDPTAEATGNLPAQKKSFKVKVLFDFNAEGADELSVKEGEIVVIESEVEGWFIGKNDKGRSGMFPANYATRTPE